MPLATDISEDWLRRLPKPELHLHLEGTVTPETWRRILARRAPRTVPPLADLQARYRFQDIAGFFDVFLSVVRSLQGPEDYRLIAREAGLALSRHGVVYAELHTSIAGAQWAGRLNGDEMLCAMEEGLAEAEAEGGPAWRLIVDVCRDFCAQGSGDIALGLATRHRGRGVAALGMGGSEDEPAGVAAGVFAAARAAGLRVTAHAGEQAGPDSIWGVLEAGAERLGHAARAPEDPALVRYLSERRVPLEMCPASNVRTGAVSTLEAHPVGGFLRAGLNVSLNTDDPPFFGTDPVTEYRRVADAFGLCREEVLRLARNGFEAAFLPEPAKAALLARLDHFVAEG